MKGLRINSQGILSGYLFLSLLNLSLASVRSSVSITLLTSSNNYIKPNKHKSTQANNRIVNSMPCYCTWDWYLVLVGESSDSLARNDLGE